MQNPLLTPVQYIKGVGPKMAKLLERRGIVTIYDLLYHVPFRYIDRRQIDSIGEVRIGRDRTIIGEVLTSGVTFLGRKRKKIFEVIVGDETGEVSAKWFHFHKFMEKRFHKGSRVLLTGELTEYSGEKQFIHPEVEVLDEEGDADTPEVGGRIFPIYPSTEGLTQRYWRKIVKNAWEKYGSGIKSHIPNDLKTKYNLEDYRESLEKLHFPPQDSDVGLYNVGRSGAQRTLIFDEFFILELCLAMLRKGYKKEDGYAFKLSKERYEGFKSALPFTLTNAQERVIREIYNDMEMPHPMNRLLQGDVGSGKTVVALAAAVEAVANGCQAAIMAPTEILAEQHFKTIEGLAGALNLECALLTSGVKGRVRDTIYKHVELGNIPLIVGTHALIQEDLKFKNLGFVVIDEQHRFGVMQRAAIKKKGGSPDILVMTATPIPRTLAMTLYGDLDVSILDELPKGRRPIITRIFNERQREHLYEGIKIELDKGRQAYVVYPLIEESEKIDLKNATEMSERLKEVFAPTYKVQLLHGRMRPHDKDEIMSSFKEGKIHVLAATSVVEVGVDVPNATAMVVEHAERFGLSQLHQLRGRVGRSHFQSYCILMVDYRHSEDARRRLAIMAETNDGFKIAEEDLKIRGPGEFLGTRQSGLPEFRVANILRDVGILQYARDAAFKLIEEDPNLDAPQNKPMKDVILMRWKGQFELGEIG